MSAYTKLRVAELRELCEERGLEYKGLNTVALLDALRQDDRRAEEETDNEEEEGDDGNDVKERSYDEGSEIQLGDDLFSNTASVLGATGGSGQVFTGENGESESLKALRLQLAWREKELELKNAMNPELLLMNAGNALHEVSTSAQPVFHRQKFGMDSVVSTSNMTELIATLKLPQAQIMKFDGDPMKSWTFIRTFDNCIGDVAVDAATKFNRLQQYCTGNVEK